MQPLEQSQECLLVQVAKYVTFLDYWSDHISLFLPCVEPGGARRCPGHSLPISNSPLCWLGFFCWFVWVFFCIYSQTPLCIHFRLFEEKLSQMFCCPSAVDVWLKEAVSCHLWSLNLTIIVLQTKLSAIIGIFSSVICLAYWSPK